MDGTRYYLQYKTDYINFDIQSLTLHFSPYAERSKSRKTILSTQENRDEIYFSVI